MPFRVSLQILHKINININWSLGNPVKQQPEHEILTIFGRAVLEKILLVILIRVRLEENLLPKVIHSPKFKQIGVF